MTPRAALLQDGERLHLQHGPIDLVIGADGDRESAFAAASARFATVLEELVKELRLLRFQVKPASRRPVGAVAQRMDVAVRRHCTDTFVTRMAAVAGSVADEVLAAMCREADLCRAYVNNGGDIALHLGQGQHFTTAMLGQDGRDLGRIRIDHTDPVRGIATSGRHGRSLSLGIADSVTVLASNAACADVAATLIANAVDLPGHSGVTRRAASTLVDDTDLGDQPVVVECARLQRDDINSALEAGLNYAETCVGRSLITGASLFLQGESRMTQGHHFTDSQRTLVHA